MKCGVSYRSRISDVAAPLLQNSELSIEAIAARCGFDDARHFRRLWHRYSVSPTVTRQQQPKPPAA